MLHLLTGFLRAHGAAGGYGHDGGSTDRRIAFITGNATAEGYGWSWHGEHGGHAFDGRTARAGSVGNAGA